MDVSTVLNSTIVINGSAVYICTTVINGKLPSGMAEELSKALVIIDESTRFLAITSTLGSGCSTAVERTPHIKEVVGSNPARCWALFSPLFSHYCVLNSGHSRRYNTSDFPIKISLAVQLEAKQDNAKRLSKNHFISGNLLINLRKNRLLLRKRDWTFRDRSENHSTWD